MLDEILSAEIWAWFTSSAPPSTPPQRYSSQQRSAVLCRALPCFPMLLALLYFFIIVRACQQCSKYHATSYRYYYYYTRFCTYDVVIGSQTMHAQLSLARLYIARQRSAAQCGAVPCPSFCGPVSCGSVRSSSIQQQLLVVVVVPGMIQIPGLCTSFAYSSFCFLQLIVLSRSPCPPPPRAIIARTAVQNVTSSTQHSAWQLALRKNLLALLSIRCSHQIMAGLFFLPHLFTCFSQLHSSLVRA